MFMKRLLAFALTLCAVSETAEANTINQLTRYLNITLDLPGQPVIPVSYIFTLNRRSAYVKVTQSAARMC